MATNATIASQISRISNSRDILRNKGVKMHLVVPAGTYWDDSTDTDITTTTASALTNTDQIDKIAKAFDSIAINQNKEIKVPITVTTDGTTTTAQSYTLDTGFYANATIVPFIRVDQVDDIVINVEMVSNRELSQQSAVIVPSAGFNYIGQFGYTIKDGAISGTNAGFDSQGVTVKVETSGWLDKDATKKVNVPTSNITSKVGDNAATTVNSGAEITPSNLANTTLTISKGIYGSDRTLIVKSVGSQTHGTAAAPDILSGKTAWVDGIMVTGTMPNYGGTATEEKYTEAASFNNYGGKLAIQPKLGYYNDYSSIKTTIDIRTKDSLKFDTTVISNPVLESTMTKQTYYETIPAGYYASQITRKVYVENAVVTTNVDYTNHKAVLTVGTPGWISGIREIEISAGPAKYNQVTADLQSPNHTFTVTPAKDLDGNKTSYLTQVTINNTIIFDLLSKI